MALTRITKGVIKPNENYDTHNINSTGIVTATKFVGPFDNINVSGAATFSGNVSIAGTLTYEDVTNVDSVGIITAQKDLHVGAGVSVVGILTASVIKSTNLSSDRVVFTTTGGQLEASGNLTYDGVTLASGSPFDLNADLDVDGHTNLDNVSVAGISTFSGIVDAVNTPASIRVAQDIQHKGDATTKISFPTSGEISFDTSGHDRIYIKSNGRIGMGTVTPANDIHHFSDGLNGNSFRLENREGYITLINDANGLYLDAEYFNFRNRAGSTSYASINTSGNLSVFYDLDVDGHTNLDNVSIAGVSTFSGGAGAASIAANSDIRFANSGSWTGEHAGKIQYFNNRLYLQGGSNGHQLRDHTGGTTFEMGTTGSCAGVNLNLSQNVTFSGDVIFSGDGDNITFDKSTDDIIFNNGTKAIFGTSQNLEIYHSSNVSHIAEGGAGPLRISTDEFQLMNVAQNKTMIYAAQNLAVSLNYNGNTKIQTTDTGAVITGIATATTVKSSYGGIVNELGYISGGAEGYTGTTSNHALFIGTAGSNRIKISNSSAATSIGGSMVFNAMLTVQGDVSGQIFTLKAAENTNRLMVAGSDTNGVEINLYDDTGGQRGILGVSGTEFFIKAPNSSAPMTFYTTPSGGSQTERFKITSVGNALFGGTGVSQSNRQLVIGSNSEANLAIETHNTSASETANIRFYRSRGTAASPTTLVDNDVLSQLLFYGHDGNDYAHTAAFIRVKCNGTVASNQMPGEMTFHTNHGATYSTERLKIQANGRITMGEADFDASNDLHIKKGNSGGDVAIRITNNSGTNSGTTASLYFTTSPTQDFNTAYIQAVRDGGRLNFGYSTNSPTVCMRVSTDKVGMGGETNPIATLTINKGSVGSNNSYSTGEILRLEGYDSTNSKHGIGFGRYGGGANGYKPAAFIGAQEGIWSNYTNCHLVFATRISTSDDEPTERFRIRNDGDITIKSNDKGWVTIEHGYNGRGMKRHTREFNTGSSAATYNLIRVRRHYWGWGHYKFTVKRVYYSGILDSVFYLNGHGRDDGSYNPSYSITEYQHNGSGSNVQSSGRITITSPSGSSPGDVYANYVDVQLQCPAYMYLIVEVEAAASNQDADISNLASDQYALHP